MAEHPYLSESDQARLREIENRAENGLHQFAYIPIPPEGFSPSQKALCRHYEDVLWLISKLQSMYAENEQLKEKLLEVESYASDLESDLEDLQRELESLD